MKIFVLLSLKVCILCLLTGGVWAQDYCQSKVDIREIANVVDDKKIVLIGEFHGSEETPALLVSLACYYAKKQERVLIALEMPVDQNDQIDRYIQSETVMDKNTLLANKFWQENLDGRGSAAMFQVFESVRDLSARYDVDVKGTDIPYFDPNFDRNNVNRDRYMGTEINRYFLTGQYDRILYIAGNYHTRILERDGDNSNSVTYWLGKDEYFSLNVSNKSGSTWACLGSVENFECKEHILSDRSDRPYPANRYLSQDEFEAPNYHGTVFFDRVTASLPEVQRNQKLP